MSSIAAPKLDRRDTCSVLTAAATGIAFGYAAILAILLFQQKWILTAGGVPMPSDFLAYRAAGIAALRGNAASTYDLHAFHVLQISLTRPFPGYFYWNYPPLFFWVVTPLALLAYVPAYLLWIATTGTACAIALGRIARNPQAIVCALASPAFLLTAYVGQNGFLSAALMGGFLLCLRERPIVAGILLALMTYKPQLGILFPLALMAGGHWRALGWALAATAIVSIASGLAFGVDSYILFFRSLATVSRTYLTLGGEGWAKVQSMYSVARFLGSGGHAAWLVQVLTSVVCALGVLWLWRSDKAYELKAAGLVVATMLSIPYLHEYDFPMILVAFALLYRQHVFDRAEWLAFAAANLLMAAFLFQLAPVGPAIVMIAGALVLRRAILFPPEAACPYKAAPLLS
jgi:arabinofuranan 3-O-arabinosyltransferase